MHATPRPDHAAESLPEPGVHHPGAARDGGPRTGPVAAAGEHLVVVVAHPDDETFGCGSLIAQASRAGARVTVISASRGEAGERRPDPTTDAWPLALLRETELCQAALVLGVDDVEFLDLLDSGFDGDPPTGSIVATPVDVVAEQLAVRLERLRPSVVLTLDGCDGHRDHVHVRDAVGAALGRLDRPVRLVHASLARSLMRAWAEAMRAQEPDRAHLSIDVEQLGRPDDELTAIDTSDVLAVRERAIACHLSQASPFDALPADLRHRFLTVDHVVHVDVVANRLPACSSAVAAAREPAAQPIVSTPARA